MTEEIPPDAEAPVSDPAEKGRDESRPYATAPLALILLDIGAPETPKDAGQWLNEVYSDPLVMQASVAGPFLGLWAKIISMLRRRTLSSALDAVGGAPPEKSELEKLAAVLAMGLDSRLSCSVYPLVAFRHAKPGVEEALEQASRAGARRAVGLFARTFASSAGSQSMRKHLSLAADDKPDLDVSMIDGFEEAPAIHAAFAEEAKDALASLPESERAGAHLLFLLQGLPIKGNRDPALPRAQSFAQAVKDAMGVSNPSSLAYQTGVDPRAPLLPDVVEELTQLAKKKVSSVLFIPISHACEGLATLWEIDKKLIDLAKNLGVANVARAKAPAKSSLFRAALENLVAKHLEEMSSVRA